MVWNPSLILYACAAKGPVVMAEYTSPSPTGSEQEAWEMYATARRCIAVTPPRHSMFSHTVQRRSYTFVIDHPFAYFAISHEDLGVEESLRFLQRVKRAFSTVAGSLEADDEAGSLCFQRKMSPLFSGLLQIQNGVESPQRSPYGREEAKAMIHSSPATMKKRVLVGGDANTATRDVDGAEAGKSYGVSRNGVVCGVGKGSLNGDGKKKGREIWRMHVWVVLVIDLIVFAVLFTIWVGVCGGYRCIDR